MNGTTLVSTCKDFFGKERLTSLPNAAACKDIRDVNGDLRCVISAKHVGGNHATDFDIVSLISDTVNHGVETKHFRIDNPQVWSDTNDLDAKYPDIAIKPGDAVSFQAGGCVQTGGSGATWKSYVAPEGSASGNMYSGTAQIRSVTPGGFTRIGGLMGCQPWTMPRPKIPGEPAEQILELSYQDNNLSDNGYYSHDDGNNDQCKNIGPAFVELTVVSGQKEKLVTEFSPHCKPFDLTWDTEKEDFNGLPRNPQWAWQLSHPHQQPDFAVMCKAAFPGDDGLTIDTGQLSQLCTSQAPTADTHWAFFSACDGWPLQGHLNWMIAAYSGVVTWEGISTTNGFWDCDYNLQLQVPGVPGLTMSGTPPANATALGLEFDPRETIQNMGSPFWKQTQGYVDSNGVRTLHDIGDHQMSAHFNGASGMYAVVIGLTGLDAEHGAFTESHPVFAMAVRTKRDLAGNKSSDHWAFFLRNAGNEGGCGSQMHHWDSPDGEYFIQLPWPQGATEMDSLLKDVDITAWQGHTDVRILQAEKTYTLVRVTVPPGTDGFGVDGEFTATYTVPSNVAPQPAGGGSNKPKRGEREEEEHDFAEQIADSAVRSRFADELSKIQVPQREPTQSMHLSVPLEVGTVERQEKAITGRITRARTGPNPMREAVDSQLVRVVGKYRKDLKIDPDKLRPSPVVWK